MRVTEFALYQLARALYRTEVAHSSSMKSALASQQQYDEYRSGEVDRILRTSKRFGIDLTNRAVLDLGCNDGAITRQYLSRRPASLIGIDVDADAIARARARSDVPVQFRLGTTTHLPVDDGSIDVILCYDVFEHVSNPVTILG